MPDSGGFVLISGILAATAGGAMTARPRPAITGASENGTGL
jgi:hypothetical protein